MPRPDEPPIPPLPNQGRMDNASRAINCINRMIGILEIYGSRWEQAAALRDKFKDESAPMLASLRQRMEIMAASPERNGTIRYFKQEPIPDLGLGTLMDGDEWRNFLPEANGTSLSPDSPEVKSESFLMSCSNNGGFSF